MRLASALLVLFILATTLTAFGFYIHHWAQRQLRLGQAASTEGTLVKRYLPAALYVRRERERHLETQRQAQRVTTLKRRSLLVLVLATLAVTLAAIHANWYQLVWIDLSDGDISALDTTRHHWVRDVDTTLPRIAGVLPELQRHGLVLITGVNTTPVLSSQPPAAAWLRLMAVHGVTTRGCTWHTAVTECGGEGIYVVLPGAWDLPGLERLLAEGRSILLYGPPAQVYAEGRTLEFHGLEFAPAHVADRRPLALVGDQVLTLGMDAGLVVDAPPAFAGYTAHSSHPQAVSIDEDHEIGGELLTRLYAQRVGKGRFVWMDFAPAPDTEHANLPSSLRHEAITAAALRYLLRGHSRAWATWPGGRTYAGMLSVDTEDKFEEAGAVIAMARRLEVPLNWYILSNELQRHRATARALASVGEIGCHGDTHADFTAGDARDQLVRLARCRKVLRDLTGATPLGFRPPEERYNDATLDAVSNTGMAHYFAETNSDRAVPALERSLQGDRTLVSLPRIGSDDFELWHRRELNLPDSLATATRELDWGQALGGLLIFDFHTQFVTGPHLQVVEHYARRLRGDHAYLATAGDMAAWWRFRDDLKRGITVDPALVTRFQPVLLSVSPEGDLVRIPVSATLARGSP